MLRLLKQYEESDLSIDTPGTLSWQCKFKKRKKQEKDGKNEERDAGKEEERETRKGIPLLEPGFSECWNDQVSRVH